VFAASEAKARIRADASKISAFNILLAFELDMELFLIKIAPPQFAAFQIGEARFFSRF